jgi:hypothetical protein
VNYLLLDKVISPVLFGALSQRVWEAVLFHSVAALFFVLICILGESVSTCLGEVMRFEKEMDFWNVKDCNLFHCVFSFFLVTRIHKILLTKMKIWTMRYLNI